MKGPIQVKTLLMILCLSMGLGFSSDKEALSSAEKKICLNMIVKNESKVIGRCLESLKGVIDYWVIVDTGSTDGTQSIIKELMRDIPGELHERPWVDFGYNRSEALRLTRGKGQYVLFMDADETLDFSHSNQKLPTEKDFYYINVRGTTPDFLVYNRFFLINHEFDWDWKDVIHEYLVMPKEVRSGEILTHVKCITDSDGFRSEDPKKYYRDAQVLETALKKEPENSRYVFYLAQSYANAGERDLAIQFFEKRASMKKGWDKEIFWSYFCAGQLQQETGKKPELFVDNYSKAYRQDPNRAEPLLFLAEYYSSQGIHSLAYSLASLAYSLKKPDDEMYVQDWVYEYGIIQSLSYSALKLENYKEARALMEQCLKCKSLPPRVREMVENRLKFVLSKI